MNFSICPKCHYQRQAADAQLHPDICPACGIAYTKWLAKHTSAATEEKNDFQSVENEVVIYQNLTQQIVAACCYVPEKVAIESYWARVVMLILFALWGGYFITAGISWEKLGSSFMHNINLPFHEFGHVLFMPFGRFMMILGGSLFQVIMPLGLLMVFVFKQRDTFAASIMLWWSGQSFIDLSPYIADAEYRALPLVGGGGEESHDWGNLLTMLNLLPQTQFIAKCCFTLGAIIIISALLWGILLLRLQKTHLVAMRDL
jgi:hypothetical protein